MQFLCAEIAAAATPSPSPSPAQPPLLPEQLRRLEETHTAAAQDEILRAAKVAPSDPALWNQLLQHGYKLGIDGEYTRAQTIDDLVLRLGGGEEKAAAHIQNAYLAREAGNVDLALEELDQAFQYLEAHPGGKRSLISACQSRGICYLAESNFAEALKWLHRALSLSEEINYAVGIVPALNSIGEVYRSQGEPERALSFYERARRIVGNDEAWNMAFVFNNIGMCYEAMGDLDRAIENISRARAVAEKVNARPRVATSLAVLGALELRRGHLQAARDFYEQSLKLGRELGEAAGQVQATLGLAQVAAKAGDAAGALAQARSAAALARQSSATDQVAAALTLCGEALVSLGREAEAKSAYENAIRTVEALRGQVAGGEIEREQLFAQEIAPYRDLVALLVREKETEAALFTAEKASARILLDVTNSGRAEWREVLSPEEHARLRELNLKASEARRELERRSAKTSDSAGIAAAEAVLRQARSAQEDFAALMESSHPELRRMTPPAAFASLAQLQPALRGGKSALLRFLVGEEDSYLFLVTLPNESGRPQLRVISLGKNRAALSRLTNDYRQRLAARSLGWKAPARELYDGLLRPALAELKGVEDVIIVPDGPLWELPFQSLESAEDHPLLLDFALRYAPSLTLLAQREKPPAAAPAHELLAFVNPALPPENEAKPLLLDHSWQPLPETEKQAQALANIYPQASAQILTGAAARERTFKEEAGDTSILHFATHGVLDDHAPLYSYLLLSQENLAPDEDGRLEARELMQLRLHARLAILCGCETARGELTAGEGVVGLSWGFLVAGCPATIVSQWKVDSASSSELMIQLHEKLHGGAANAEALRQASLAVRRDPRYRHPFYWAPFMLVSAR